MWLNKLHVVNKEPLYKQIVNEDTVSPQGIRIQFKVNEKLGKNLEMMF